MSPFSLLSLTIKVPQRNTHTTVHIRARRNRTIIISNLLRLSRSIRRQVQPHVQLRDGNVHAQANKRIHVGLLICLSGGLPYNKMRLEAHAIDLNPTSLKLRDELLGYRGFVAGVLNVVIVVVQLHAQVIVGDGLRGGLKGEEEVLGANGVVPNVGLPGAGGRVAESLIHHIPRIAPVTKVCDEIDNVVDENGAEGLVGPVGGWGRHPSGELVVPDEVVAADEFSCGLSDVEEVVSASVVEDALFWLGELVL